MERKGERGYVEACPGKRGFREGAFQRGVSIRRRMSSNYLWIIALWYSKESRQNFVDVGADDSNRKEEIKESGGKGIEGIVTNTGGS